ncbi:Uncharacterised protein [Yersinia pseudotuberculosis]|uniref:Uncharacterized protein n=1 Tax=Yersinia pseudotuberculosis TaxID=633 RepID=A0A380QB55_YERPU|nr:Uncharacterised protein [Yersinia pseudotuberculosis]
MMNDAIASMVKYLITIFLDLGSLLNINSQVEPARA